MDSSGMTLIETLVAITILTVAIVSPMSLTMQSLSASYYARDQVAAFHLAQEAIEALRSVRDGNILTIAYGASDVCAADSQNMHLLCGFYIGTPFTIDARNNTLTQCTLPDGTDQDTLPDCPPLQTDGDLFGYGLGENTRYTRTAIANYVDGSDQNEIAITVTVTWLAGPLQQRNVRIYENLYRWVDDQSL